MERSKRNWMEVKEVKHISFLSSRELEYQLPTESLTITVTAQMAHRLQLLADI